MTSDVSGRTALVTGGASGIGAAVARRLAAAGAIVTIADVADATGQAVADELGGTFHHLDVADSAAWTQLVNELGSFDIAILNAGVTTRTNVVVEAAPGLPLSELTDADYHRAMGINLDGVVFGTRALVPGMCAAGRGDIIATASMAGLIGISMDPIYGANKHAVVGFVKSMADLLTPHGICISSLNPGFVDTPILGDAGAATLRGLGVPVIDAAMIADLVMRSLTERVPGAQWVAWGDYAGTYQWNPPFS